MNKKLILKFIYTWKIMREICEVLSPSFCYTFVILKEKELILRRTWYYKWGLRIEDLPEQNSKSFYVFTVLFFQIFSAMTENYWFFIGCILRWSENFTNHRDGSKDFLSLADDLRYIWGNRNFSDQLFISSNYFLYFPTWNLKILIPTLYSSVFSCPNVPSKCYFQVVFEDFHTPYRPSITTHQYI